MQPFYPPPLKHRRVLIALAMWVLCMHLWGLGSLAAVWPVHSSPNTPVTVRLQTAALTSDQASETQPKASALPARKPRPRATPHEGFHAARTAQAEIPDEVTAPADTVQAPATEEPTPAVTETAPSTEATATPATPEPVPVPLPAPVTPPSEPAVAINPQSQAPPWLANAKFVFPAPSKLLYDVIGESKGIRYSADGELVWQHDGANYKMNLDIRHVLLGSRSQNSIGQMGAQGVQPTRFGDKYKQEVAAHFERDKGLVVFSASSTPQVLQPGAQDRLSLFVQLGALLAGTPELRQAGQQIPFQVVAAKSSDQWAFQVDKEEVLSLPIGQLNTWKISRMPLKTLDQTAEIWLSPAHGYLPVKVRIAQSNGDVLEQQLRKVQAP